MNGHQQVRHEFHARAIAKCTDIVVRLGKTVEHLRTRSNGLRVATGVHQQIFFRRLGPRATEGAVQHVPARGLVMHGLLVFDRQRAGFDQDAPWNLRRHQALRTQHHGIQSRHTWQGGDHNGSRFGHRLGRCGGSAPGRHKGLHAFGRHIKADHLKTCCQQVGRHGAAHDAQAHQAHRLGR